MRVTEQYLKQMFGEFWDKVWREPALVETMVASYREVFTQLEDQRTELDSYLARMHIPSGFFKHFNFMHITEDTIHRRYRRIGTFNMDEGVPMGSYMLDPPVFEIATDFDDIAFIMDKPVRPNVMWQRGQDFVIEDGNIVMFANPLDYFVGGVRSDEGAIKRSARLWLCSTRLDQKALTSFFGAPFNFRSASTPYYKRILNGIWDLAVEGATTANVSKFVCAVADTDTAFADGTVESVWVENERSWVLAAGAAHGAPLPATPVVAEGDNVERGDILFDNVGIYKGTESIGASDIPLLHLHPGLLSAEYETGIGLENASFALEGSRFPVQGQAAVVESFWEDVERRLQEEGIDLRALMIQDQTPPFTVNPFDFIRCNILKNNISLIRFDSDTVPDRAINLKLLGYLLDYMPAATTFISFAETNAETETAQEAGIRDIPPEAFYVGTASELENVRMDEYIKAGPKLY